LGLTTITVIIYGSTLAFEVETLKKKNISQRFGEVMERLTMTSRMKMAYNMVFAIRRYLFVLICIYMEHLTGILMMLFMFINELSLIYIAHSRPLKGRIMNNNEIFGELITCLILISQVLFTDFCHNAEMKFATGWYYCLLIALSCLYFYLFVFREILNFISLRVRRYFKILERK
jgi:hypothetical protein